MLKSSGFKAAFGLWFQGDKAISSHKNSKVFMLLYDDIKTLTNKLY